jgi:hypothetical protein
VGVFPNDAAIDRLVTAIVVEQHDEWRVSQRRYLCEAVDGSAGVSFDPDRRGVDPWSEQ